MEREPVGFDPRQSDQREQRNERDAARRDIALHVRGMGIAYQRFCHSPTSPFGKMSRMAMSKIMPMPSL